MQLATSAQGQPLGRPSITPGDAYVYDISHRNGMYVGSVFIQDIEGDPVNLVDMAEAGVCPVATGACVTSAAGGTIEGYDMYGQLVREDVAAAGTSTIALAFVTNAPADATWTNQYGLPYMYSADADASNTDVTITPPADDEDARGTFAFAGTFVDEDPAQQTEVLIPYVVDQTNVFGTPYAERFASPEFDTQSIVITGTIDGTGLVTLTIPSTGDAEVPCQITYPDGSRQYAPSDSAPTHTLSEVWMQQYGRIIVDDAAALGNLVTVDPLGNEYAPVYVQLTGTAEPAVMASPAPPAEEPPTEEPPATLSAPPASFTTHAAADAWLDEYAQVVLGFDADTIDWTSMNLSEKKTAAQSLYDAWLADQ